jgi:3-oxoacyl-[acyl-carrier protein] reductase
MDLQLQGLNAVVTGGSAGIGAAIVRVLAAEGCNVSFCARTAERIGSLIDATAHLPGHVRGTALDVRDAPAFGRWIEEIAGIDIFIPNVSALSTEWQAAMDVDMSATIATTELVIPKLAHSSRAAITYIGSKAGSLAAPGAPAYGAAKAAMAHYMKSLSARLLPRIRVNTVSPGDTLVPGGFWDKVRARDPAAFARTVERNPLGRLASAEEIAKVVAFISSPAASFVAGANWYVDGGSIAHVQS